MFLLVFGTFFLVLAMKDAGWLCLVSVARTCLAAAQPARFGSRLQRYGDEVQTVL